MCIILAFKCGKQLFLYFNLLFVFYTLLYSGHNKTGHSGNKILPTQRTSTADGLSLATIWHMHFGKKVCEFLFASYWAVARYFWSRSINNTFLHLFLSVSFCFSLYILNLVISSIKKCMLQNYRRWSSYKLKRKKKSRKHFNASVVWFFFTNPVSQNFKHWTEMSQIRCHKISCKQIGNVSKVKPAYFALQGISYCNRLHAYNWI